MYTCGLIITFEDDPIVRGAAEYAVVSAGPFTLGESSGPRAAAVLEAHNPQAAHDWHDWALGVPGVIGLEVVFVHWDEASEEVSHVSY
jgi:hypothetical protein